MHSLLNIFLMVKRRTVPARKLTITNTKKGKTWRVMMAGRQALIILMTRNTVSKVRVLKMILTWVILKTTTTTLSTPSPRRKYWSPSSPNRKSDSTSPSSALRKLTRSFLRDSAAELLLPIERLSRNAPRLVPRPKILR